MALKVAMAEGDEGVSATVRLVFGEVVRRRASRCQSELAVAVMV
jgi:hypothetical protein